jgi:hypothetical protein
MDLENTAVDIMEDDAEIEETNADNDTELSATPPEPEPIRIDPATEALKREFDEWKTTQARVAQEAEYARVQQAREEETKRYYENLVTEEKAFVDYMQAPVRNAENPQDEILLRIKNYVDSMNRRAVDTAHEKTLATIAEAYQKQRAYEEGRKKFTEHPDYKDLSDSVPLIEEILLSAGRDQGLTAGQIAKVLKKYEGQVLKKHGIDPARPARQNKVRNLFLESSDDRHPSSSKPLRDSAVKEFESDVKNWWNKTLGIKKK